MADYSNPELEQALRSAPISDEVRAKAWDAYVSNDTPDGFYKAFKGLDGLSPTMKSQLRAMKFPQAAKNPVEAPPIPGSVLTPKATGPREEPWYRRAVVNLHDLIGAPDKSQSGLEQFGRGAVRGALQGAEQMTSPENLAAMGAMTGASAIPVVGQILDLAGGAYITGEMALNLVKSVPKALDAFQRGDYGQLGQIMGQDVVDALIAKKSGEHLSGRVGRIREKPEFSPASANPARSEAAYKAWRDANFKRGGSGWQDRSGNSWTDEGLRLEYEEKFRTKISGTATPRTGPDYGEHPQTKVNSAETTPARGADYSKTKPRRIEKTAERALPPGIQPRQIEAAPPEQPDAVRTRMAGVSETPVPPGAKGYKETTGAPADVEITADALSATPEQHAKALAVARSLPRETLESNIGQMREAAAKQAIERLPEAQKDPTKEKELKQWLQRVGARIQDFQDLLEAAPPGAEKPPAAKSGQKLATIPGGKGKASTAPEGEPTPESIGKKLLPGVRREQMRADAKGGKKDLTPEGTTETGKKIKQQLAGGEGSGKKGDAPGSGAKILPMNPKAPPEEGAAPAAAKPKEPEGKPPQSGGAAAEPEKPTEEGNREFAAGVEPGVKRILDTAKTHSLKMLHIVIPRAEGKKPIKISVNTEFDDLESIIDQIKRFLPEITGMASVESPDMPGLRWQVELRSGNQTKQ